MHPIFLRLGPIEIHWYGVCMATGFLLFLGTWTWLSRGTHRNSNYLSNLLTVLILSALFGARAAYVAEHWSAFSPQPWSILKVNEGGLMFYGGLLSAWIALSIFARFHKERWLDFMDLIVTAVPVGHAVGRIGCFLEGCCFGDRCNSALGVHYPVGSHLWAHQVNEGMIGLTDVPLPVYPSQLFESFANFVIYGILLWHYRRRRKEGEQVALYALLYAPVRYVVEIFRSDVRMSVGPFTISQAISLAIFIFGVSLALYLHRCGRPVDTTTEA